MNINVRENFCRVLHYQFLEIKITTLDFENF